MDQDIIKHKDEIPQPTKEDFVSDQMVKWCPGCGDHAILSSVEKVFPKLGVRKEDFVVVSGIGCSSRFPYYMNTYGIHGIHGRAAAIATGVKLANPKLSVWMITGDGDCMAIGGNHFIHAVRRNIDINILLFNNKIYGLTKGQFSPTTPKGFKTKSSPQGTFEQPFNAGELVIGAQGNFFARAIDNNPKMMVEVLFEAARHTGTTVVEILQNCVIFNNNIHELISSRDTRDDNQIFLKHGEPMLFGKGKKKGILLRGTQLEVVELGKNGITEKDILVHNIYNPDPGVHIMLSRMTPPAFPAALGVIRSVTESSFDQNMEEVIEQSKRDSKIKNVDDLLRSGNTWKI
ncbi:MAG: 2-oxoacid:ferredoxin oxidoreductase subunit beta [Bacteroidales bacterium]|nr:2-oxoacid:ferredoxin oxidoreductase subunit beta [Bacteroidales bacterium]MCF8343683.1 2-oxoacid:ferredoxin oxidoreductase subunit beta [Bacteroidales bacterium]MCF8351667.1 2-oxoacid:ferredoxin oxidoreductase subunit beta [Bacteroidales bacterium]MCF8374758.1 2-oxoacid:ferredoxin oxidoreductase subunit beta [Bacteroidales bacterium]MCF8399838.1 2-oxoacid:ferredoxin oxidoreductase subunit beta [Bacteroidales bacterium]